MSPGTSPTAGDIGPGRAGKGRSAGDAVPGASAHKGAGPTSRRRRGVRSARPDTSAASPDWRRRHASTAVGAMSPALAPGSLKAGPAAPLRPGTEPPGRWGQRLRLSPTRLAPPTWQHPLPEPRSIRHPPDRDPTLLSPQRGIHTSSQGVIPTPKTPYIYLQSCPRGHASDPRPNPGPIGPVRCPQSDRRLPEAGASVELRVAAQLSSRARSGSTQGENGADL